MEEGKQLEEGEAAGRRGSSWKKGKQLEEGEALLQEDVSENYSIKQQNEIMSAHWVSTGVTLLTAVLNTTDDVKSSVI